MTFRIQRSTYGNVVIFILSGRIEKERLSVMQGLLQSEAEQNEIAIDLNEVKLVDRGAVALLEACETKGAKLTNCPPYIREWIEKERLGGKHDE